MNCTKCRRPTDEPRRGLCPACYQEAYNGRTKARACACCGTGDPRVLVRRRVEDAMLTLCANCAAILGRRRLTLDALVREVRPPGDRRARDRRRDDRRAANDRRAHVDVTKLNDDRREAGRRAGDSR